MDVIDASEYIKEAYPVWSIKQIIYWHVYTTYRHAYDTFIHDPIILCVDFGRSHNYHG